MEKTEKKEKKLKSEKPEKEVRLTRKQQAMKTRRRLFDKAIQIFATKDMDDVRIKDICDAAGVSVGTFYLYYASKEDLLLEGYRVFDEEIISRVQDKKYDSYLDALYFIIAYQCGDHRGIDIGDATENDQLTNILRDYAAGELLLWKQELRIQIKTGGRYVIEPDRPMNKYVLSLVESAQEAGELTKDVSANEIASTVLRMSRGVIFDWAVRNGSYNAAECALHDVKFYLRDYIPKK